MREIVSPLDGFASPFGPQRGFNPLRIFANDELGVWFEANDATTLFTDVAGTTPVTAPGDAVAYQRDKSGRGNHRTQATVAARPLYALHPVGGVRNLLQYTEEFDNAVWSAPSGNATITANASVAPNGTNTADQFTVGATTGDNRRSQSGLSIPNGDTITVYGKANTANWLYVFVGNTTATAWFDLSAGTVGTSANSTASIEDVGDGWHRCRITNNSTTGNAVWIEVADGDSSSVGVVGQSLFVWGAQLEQGPTATNYQRVGSFLDVFEEGKARRGRIWYNGTSHFMQTGTITPGTDKVQVFAGVRKLESSTAIIAETSDNYALNNGSFAIISRPDGYGFGSSGSNDTAANVTTGYSPPITNIFTGLGDISGDSAILRVDGTQVAQSTVDQGTGNYLAQPIYFGARAGTSLFYNGYEDTSIVRFGPNLDASVIGKVESYVASKTPESTL